MHVEHIAIYSPDIEKLASFYARYFGAAVGDKYVNPKKGFQSRFLSFAAGARVELMQSDQLVCAQERTDQPRMGLSHFAIALGSQTGVDGLAARLRADGFDIVDGPRWTGDGYYEAVVLDPDGNRVEISA